MKGVLNYIKSLLFKSKEVFETLDELDDKIIESVFLKTIDLIMPQAISSNSMITLKFQMGMGVAFTVRADVFKDNIKTWIRNPPINSQKFLLFVVSMRPETVTVMGGMSLSSFGMETALTLNLTDFIKGYDKKAFKVGKKTLKMKGFKK